MSFSSRTQDFFTRSISILKKRWNGGKFRETKPRFPFLNKFRDIVVSGDEKLLKPDAAIYNVLLKRNAL
jgi:hypothetical protein